MDSIFQELFTEELSTGKIENTPEYIHIELNSTRETQKCPVCGNLSVHKHCSYTRTAGDLPIMGKRVILTIHAYKFKCNNSECSVKVFCQYFDKFLGKSQQKTERLLKYLRDIAFTNSGECGARIYRKNNVPVSGDTLIRIVKSWNPPEMKATKIGVDDWAYKKNIHMEH
ncbi:MAG TPA: transposase family protein [Methanobacterium sp.]|nr:transposase family protein [Methanobacterium sp.]